MKKLLVAVVLSAYLSTGAAVAQSFEEVAAQFEKAFFNTDPVNKIALRGQAVMGLPSEDPRCVDLMYAVIPRAETWYDIGLTLEYLTNVRGEARERLAADLHDRKARHPPEVREVIAYMLYDYGRHYGEVSDAEYEAMLTALEDDQAQVRRFAVLGLQCRADPEALDRLLEIWGSEKDEQVITAIVVALRQLSGKTTLGRDLQEWRSWREGNPEAELTKGFARPEYEVGSYGELELQFDASETGSGRPILVLPPYGYTNSVFRPGLSVLETVGRLIYIAMPVIGQDVEIEKNDDGIELFPVDKLVEALEVLREELKEDKVVLLSCQDSCWIALRYAQLYPDHVAAVIATSGWLDKDGYAASLEMLKMDGTEEEQLYVQVAAGEVQLASLSPSQQQGVTVGKLASLHEKATDIDACFMWETIIDQRIQGRVLIVPPVTLDKRKKITVPTLFVHGKVDRMSAVEYTSHQGKLYIKPRPKITEIATSGPLPWLDNPGAFKTQVEKFLKKNK